MHHNLTKFLLDKAGCKSYNFPMAKEIVPISPEGLDVANVYLEKGSPESTALALGIPVHKVVQVLNTREVKKYIDTIYLDRGYRNRDKIAALMDEIITSKLEEARESEMYTKKDLVDLLQIAHKMRQDEKKSQNDEDKIIKNQTNVQINEGIPQGNYGKLVQTLLNDGNNSGNS